MPTHAYHPVTDLVLLVPGFLGFEEIGGYTYFDEVLVDALRSSLSSRQASVDDPGCFAVETLDTVPTGSLLQRQAALVAELCEILEYPSYFDVERVHLIGHSTGGLDARLLLAESRLDGRPWRGPEVSLRRRIRSVLGIAAPHHGTRLVGHRDLLELSKSLPRFLARRVLDREIHELVLSGLFDLDTAELLRGFLRRPVQGWALVNSVADNHELLRDLRPDNMARHRDALPVLEDVRFGSIVTMAADHVQQPADAAKSGLMGRLGRILRDLRGDRAAPNARRGDAIFRWLRARTADPYWESDDAVDARVEAAAAVRIQAVIDRVGAGREVPVVCNPGAVLPRPVDGTISDGIVNTVRQLMRPADLDELVGVVIADHLDVIGHFDKVPDPNCPEDQGLIKSGSGFGHDQLRGMCELMAEHIELSRRRRRHDSGIVGVAAASSAPG